MTERNIPDRRMSQPHRFEALKTIFNYATLFLQRFAMRKFSTDLSGNFSNRIVRVVKSRRMRWVGHVARMGEGRGVHRVLVGKPEGKRPLGRPRRRWEDNIKLDLHEVGGSCGDSMELAQDRDRWRALVGTVRNLRVPKMRGISWLAAEPVGFSRRTLLHGVSK